MSVEKVIHTEQRLTEAPPTLSESFVSSGSDWSLLGDLMIDLGSNGEPVVAVAAVQAQAQQHQLKIPGDAAPAGIAAATAAAATIAAENMAPAQAKPDADKGLKMKIKRKSKHEEKHEVVIAEPDQKEEEQAGGGSNAKKARVDKPDASNKKKSAGQQARKDVAVNTATVGTSVEPDNLGPCETGTNISLDGIVWLETTTGLLVVNVTWRGRTYVGTLLDSSQHEFAPPCPKDYVPPMETSRNARGRGKRRGGGGNGQSNGGLRSRRQGRQLPLSSKSDESDEGSRQDGKEALQQQDQSPQSKEQQQAEDQSSQQQQCHDLPHIKCPEIGCDKRFSHLQALKWHTIGHHGERRGALLPPAFSDLSGVQLEQLREEKYDDGSTVFKVPHLKQAQPAQPVRGSPPKTVTVSKTCSVPTAASDQVKPKKEEKAPPAQDPFKPIQPKPELAIHASASAVNGTASPTELREKKKKRRSPERSPGLASKSPAALSAGIGGSSVLNANGPQVRKCNRKSDPVSPAYSDISDEGSAPLLEKEESQSTPPPAIPPVATVTSAKTVAPATSMAAAVEAPVPAPTHVAAVVPPQTAGPPKSRSSVPVASVNVASGVKPSSSTAQTPRGSPNAPQKPSLGHSPSEDTAKQAEERRQILAENSDIREPKEPPRTSQLQSPSASGRPS